MKTDCTPANFGSPEVVDGALARTHPYTAERCLVYSELTVNRVLSGVPMAVFTVSSLSSGCFVGCQGRCLPVTSAVRLIGS